MDIKGAMARKNSAFLSMSVHRRVYSKARVGVINFTRVGVINFIRVGVISFTRVGVISFTR